MKVRIKFSKTGYMKFVGHLDTMRYFQKAIRRAGLPIAFSGGYSPHMIMSFAAPLGVGVTSQGEYFDMELTETVPTAEIESRLNQTMVEGVSVLSARQVEDGKASTAMALVAAADYFVRFRQGKEPETPDWQERFGEFLSQKEIVVTKKTKRGEKVIDLRPLMYHTELLDDGVFLKLASASSNYTKPEMVMDAFLHFLGEEPKPFCYQIERREVYADAGEDASPRFVPLEALGEPVE